MGSWRKMGAFLGLVPDEEAHDGSYDEPDTYRRSDYAGYGAEERVREPEQVSRNRHRPYSEPLVQGALAVQPRPEAPARPYPDTYLVGEATSGARPFTVKLTGFGEARIIGERYREGSWIILDMTDLTDADARRVVDFAAGLAFALRGSIDKVTTRVFMLIPPDADVSAEDRRAFAGSYATR